MQNSKNFAIASLICGILSIILPWIPYGYFFAIAAGIVAIILAVKVRKLNDANKGMATGGLVTGIIGVVLAGIIMACAICAVCAVASVAGSLS
ncbi:DUF4190 domain-containing protein [Ruminococcus sp.]|uniref:DUF4190 domain-containing protein n=1 Tax=Ruminococcus sp. TaxID=41978 RepID=UPI00386F679C